MGFSSVALEGCWLASDWASQLAGRCPAAVVGMPTLPTMSTRQTCGVQLGLLGPFELVDGDRPVVVPGAGERALLALLALDAGRVVPAARLVDALWGEQLPAN